MSIEQDAADLERINALIDQLDSVLDGQSIHDCVQALTVLLARVSAGAETPTDRFMLNCEAHRLLALYFEVEMDEDEGPQPTSEPAS